MKNNFYQSYGAPAYTQNTLNFTTVQTADLDQLRTSRENQNTIIQGVKGNSLAPPTANTKNNQLQRKTHIINPLPELLHAKPNPVQSEINCGSSARQQTTHAIEDDHLDEDEDILNNQWNVLNTMQTSNSKKDYFQNPEMHLEKIKINPVQSQNPIQFQSAQPLNLQHYNQQINGPFSLTQVTDFQNLNNPIYNNKIEISPAKQISFRDFDSVRSGEIGYNYIKISPKQQQYTNVNFQDYEQLSLNMYNQGITKLNQSMYHNDKKFTQDIAEFIGEYQRKLRPLSKDKQLKRKFYNVNSSFDQASVDFKRRIMGKFQEHSLRENKFQNFHNLLSRITKIDRSRVSNNNDFSNTIISRNMQLQETEKSNVSKVNRSIERNVKIQNVQRLRQSMDSRLNIRRNNTKRFNLDFNNQKSQQFVHQQQLQDSLQVKKFQKQHQRIQQKVQIRSGEKSLMQEEVAIDLSLFNKQKNVFDKTKFNSAKLGGQTYILSQQESFPGIQEFQIKSLPNKQIVGQKRDQNTQGGDTASLNMSKVLSKSLNTSQRMRSVHSQHSRSSHCKGKALPNYQNARLIIDDNTLKQGVVNAKRDQNTSPPSQARIGTQDRSMLREQSVSYQHTTAMRLSATPQYLQGGQYDQDRIVYQDSPLSAKLDNIYGSDTSVKKFRINAQLTMPLNHLDSK
ncbi:UNKNOWN [Stylonychia lemnae]|uniref:Uncharacterized protein n=1 Tax=Stylonychia lemnae TaxID=5949 RepID=A0A078B257_STYLE|nr:UNKNOWN [Stylonychia lemnae]|eukprot:CDW88625.1 UNKNOWN [Stylonychia lemnae]